MLNRRRLLTSLAATGIGSSVLHRAIVASLDDQKTFTIEALKNAEWISDLQLTDEQRTEILNSVQRNSATMAEFRKKKLTYDVPMAIQFAPTANYPQIKTLTRSAMPITHQAKANVAKAAKVAKAAGDEQKAHAEKVTNEDNQPAGKRPSSDEALALLPVSQLSTLIRQRKISSSELTKIYLDRLKKYGPMLRCVVTLTEELALKLATIADTEIAAGNYRGPLHGIPWGAKDLIAVEGYPTSWGIPYHEKRELDHTATVAERLAEAGAVLVAKLSLGALAQGDEWFRGMTRNPWNPVQGSSGSSAGSAAASVAGLVGFAIGSETMGSILSPSTRCGASSLRPTFGRVSRHGCMPLSWSMDKIGPLCRSVEDCALVFDAIHGADGRDHTVGSFSFEWPSAVDLSKLKIGYAKSNRRPDADREDLKLIRELGCELVEVRLPTDVPIGALLKTIDIEAASVFDDLLRDNHTEGWNTWSTSFQSAQYISAVDYVRMQRARAQLMQRYAAATDGVDAIVNMNDLLLSNFTGHPSVVFPIGYGQRNSGVRVPRSMVLTGQLNEDEKLLALAHECQSQLDAHLQPPPLDDWLSKFDDGTLDGTSGD